MKIVRSVCDISSPVFQGLRYNLLCSGHCRGIVLQAGEEVPLEFVCCIGQTLTQIVVEGLFGGDVRENRGLGGFQPRIEPILEGAKIFDLNVVEQPVDTSVIGWPPDFSADSG